MRVLITGMNGFAGGVLCQLLLQKTHWTLIGLANKTSGDRVNARIQWWQIDLVDPLPIKRLLRFERPDIIFHLAAQASVPQSWEDAWNTYQVNLHGTLNLFEAVVQNRLTPRIVVIGSNEVYGAPANSEELPFTEKHLLRPNNPYGVSKVAQETLAMQYRYSHGLDVIAVRPFNHIGPGQRPSFVLSSFASQIAEIEQGKRVPVIDAGNMSAQRDFTDVRDTVRAYYMITRFADAGRIYNVCSGQPRSIQSVFDLMVQMSRVSIEVRNDPGKYRVVDTPVSYGDNSLVRQETGWEPQIPFEQTVSDILNYWRDKVSTEETNDK